MKKAKPMDESLRQALIRAFALHAEGKKWPEVAEILKLDGFVNTEGNPHSAKALASHWSKLKGKVPGPSVPDTDDTDDHGAITDTVDKGDIGAEAAMVDNDDQHAQSTQGSAEVDTVDQAPQSAVIDKFDQDREEPAKDRSAVMVAKDDQTPIDDTVDKGDMPQEAATVDNVVEAEQRVPVEEPATVAKVDKAPESAIVDKDDRLSREELITMLAEMETRLTTLVDERVHAALSASRTVKGDKVDEPPLPPKVGAAGKKFAGSKEDLRVRIDAELFKLLESECKKFYGGNMSRCLDAVLWQYYDEPALSFEKDQGKKS